MNLYRRNLLALLRRLLASSPPAGRALDFGAGDGWFAQEFQRAHWAREVVAVDVQRRRHTVVDVQVYDGGRLPFADGSFDLVYAIDVIHHCPDPRETLRDLLRCAGERLLLKDHNTRTTFDRLTLGVLDEIGNRRLGVRSLYCYQRDWEWLRWVEAEGFALETVLHPAVCETRPPLSWFVNRLHFVGLWRRVR
jgi:SAM-dependent methyltransferase